MKSLLSIIFISIFTLNSQAQLVNPKEKYVLYIYSYIEEYYGGEEKAWSLNSTKMIIANNKVTINGKLTFTLLSVVGLNFNSTDWQAQDIDGKKCQFRLTDIDNYSWKVEIFYNNSHCTYFTTVEP